MICPACHGMLYQVAGEPCPLIEDPIYHRRLTWRRTFRVKWGILVRSAMLLAAALLAVFFSAVYYSKF